MCIEPASPAGLTWGLRAPLLWAVLVAQEGFQLFWGCSVSLLAGVKLSVVSPDLTGLALCLELEKMKVHVTVVSSDSSNPVSVFK